MASQLPIGENEEFLIEFSKHWSYEGMSAEEIASTKEALIDTFGCAVEGALAPPAEIVTERVLDRGGAREATILGSDEKVPLEAATMVNGVMLRNYDLNDTLVRPLADSGTELPVVGYHPSESIPAILALCEHQGLSGREFLTTVALSYELCGRVLYTVEGESTADRGYHHASFPGILIPLVAGRLLDLSTRKIANALGMAASSVSLNVIDYMSKVPNNMMKSMACNDRAAVAVQHTRLAGDGFTGTTNVLSTDGGFFDMVFGSNINEGQLLDEESNEYVTEIFFKLYSADSTTQGSIHSLLTLVEEHDIQPEEVELIDIHIGTRPYNHTRDPNRYFQINEETADHSLPYALSVACLDRAVVPEQFREERFRDEDVIEFSERLAFHIDDAYDAIGQAGRVEIHLEDRQSVEEETVYPPGHQENPLSREQLESKFTRLWSSQHDSAAADRVIDLIENIEHVKDVSTLVSAMNP